MKQNENFPSITDEDSMDRFMKEFDKNKVEDFFKKQKKIIIDFLLKNLLIFKPYLSHSFDQLNDINKYAKNFLDNNSLIFEDQKEKEDILEQINNNNNIYNHIIIIFVLNGIEANSNVIEEVLSKIDNLKNKSKEISNITIKEKINKLIENTNEFFINLEKYQKLMQDLFNKYCQIMFNPLSILTDDIKTGQYNISSLFINIQDIKELLFSKLYQNTLNLLNDAKEDVNYLNNEYLNNNNNNHDIVIFSSKIDSISICIQDLNKLGTFSNTETQNELISLNSFIVMNLQQLLCHFESNKQKAIFLLSHLVEKDLDQLIEYISNSSFKNEILRTIDHFINKLIISNIPIQDIKFDDRLELIKQSEQDLLNYKKLFEYYKDSIKKINEYGNSKKDIALDQLNQAQRSVNNLEHPEFQFNQENDNLELLQNLEAERLQNLEVARLELTLSQTQYDKIFEKINFRKYNLDMILSQINEFNKNLQYNKTQQEIIKNVYQLYTKLLGEKILIPEAFSQDSTQDDLSLNSEVYKQKKDLFEEMQNKLFDKDASFDEQFKWLEYFSSIDNEFLYDEEAEKEYKELSTMLSGTSKDESDFE